MFPLAVARRRLPTGNRRQFHGGWEYFSAVWFVFVELYLPTKSRGPRADRARPAFNRLSPEKPSSSYDWFFSGWP